MMSLSSQGRNLVCECGQVWKQHSGGLSRKSQLLPLGLWRKVGEDSGHIVQLLSRTVDTAGSTGSWRKAFSEVRNKECWKSKNCFCHKILLGIVSKRSCVLICACASSVCVCTCALACMSIYVSRR